MLRKTPQGYKPVGYQEHASMRPQRNAAENEVLGGSSTAQTYASMRPQRNAAENVTIQQRKLKKVLDKVFVRFL